ncbi:MAG: hypothetical protein IT290_08585 [Deltaproteobacteria bacterium]|nr:hypothetical protein [Deltaproteobacteria bacterium]
MTHSGFDVLKAAALLTMFGIGVFAFSSSVHAAPDGTARDIDAPGNGDQRDAGAKLWADKCGVCHRNHTPEDFTNPQWEKIISHMREKAKLSDTEERAILDFVKSAKQAMPAPAILSPGERASD